MENPDLNFNLRLLLVNPVLRRRDQLPHGLQRMWPGQLNPFLVCLADVALQERFEQRESVLFYLVLCKTCLGAQLR